MIPISIRVEAAGPSKQTVLDLLQMQAKNFFGDEEFRLDGVVHFEVESFVSSIQQSERTNLRWAGLADYVNYREEDR